ncbi:MAG: ferritin-like domain-containing protein [Desulfococcaceae bacterium]
MTQSTFRAGEVLEMAVQIERQGVTFYETCLKTELPAKIKQVFQFLLDQEHQHIQTFQEMRQDLSDHELPESYAGETESYMQSFVKDEVFTSPMQAAEKAEGITDASEAIEYGLKIENRSIDFYQNIKGVVPTSEREAIDGVIFQEKEHKRRLESLRKEMSEK